MMPREPLIWALQPRIFSFFNSRRGGNYLKPIVHSWPSGVIQSPSWLQWTA